jgi:hypothetical protein
VGVTGIGGCVVGFGVGVGSAIGVGFGEWVRVGMGVAICLGIMIGVAVGRFSMCMLSPIRGWDGEIWLFGLEAHALNTVITINPIK